MFRKALTQFINWNFHQLLNQHFKQKRAGSIVQLGANDGKTIDPVNFLIRKQKVKSILLEPDAATFKRLQETYKDNTAVTLLNMAVSEREDVDVLPFYHLKQIPGVPYHEHFSWFGSFDISHVHKFKGGVSGFDKMLTATLVPCISINQLIHRYAPSGVSLLHLDIEGFDARVLLSMDFTTKPDIILFEHMHIEKSELLRCLSKLKAEGYRVYCYYGFDTICVRPEVKADILLRVVKLLRPRLFK